VRHTAACRHILDRADPEAADQIRHMIQRSFAA